MRSRWAVARSASSAARTGWRRSRRLPRWGRSCLAHAYQERLGSRGLRIGQVLVTLHDTEARRRYLNARATLETLLRLGVIPVVNENDTVATSESASATMTGSPPGLP